MPRAASRLDRLRAVLKGTKTMLIVLQNNPDPDAIAAGAALRLLANSLYGISCSLAHGGILGRAENKALARYMALNLRPLSEVNLDQFDLVAMVDTQPGTGNNSLDKAARVDIVIDHHPQRVAARKAAFTDIRKHYGATSTILFEYLVAAKVPLDIPIATALVYGIRSDTQDLGREAVKPDIEAHCLLYPQSNPRMLGQITHGVLPDEYFQLLHRSLINARRCGKCVFTDLGAVDNPDMISEVADLFLRHEGTLWTLVWGEREGVLLLSLRTLELEGDAGKIMRHIVDHKGTGGGHTLMAGGQIPLLEVKTPAARKRLERTLLKRFLHAIGEDDTRAAPLISG